MAGWRRQFASFSTRPSGGSSADSSPGFVAQTNGIELVALARVDRVPITYTSCVMRLPGCLERRLPSLAANDRQPASIRTRARVRSRSVVRSWRRPGRRKWAKPSTEGRRSRLCEPGSRPRNRGSRFRNRTRMHCHRETAREDPNLVLPIGEITGFVGLGQASVANLLPNRTGLRPGWGRRAAACRESAAELPVGCWWVADER